MKDVFAPLLSLALLLAACDASSPSPDAAEEVAEEGREFVNGIAPEGEEPGDVVPPPVLITPEETLAAVEAAGGLTALGTAGATEVIDKWIGTLSANPDVDDSDDLVEDLTKLRELLQASPVDGEAVGEVLEELADETEEAADDADSEAVEALAELLEEAAEALD